MDLAEIWQQHKVFLISILGALVLLFVGRGVIADQYPVTELERKSQNVIAQMQKGTDVPDSVLRDLRDQVSGMEDRLRKLLGDMQFESDPLFVLPRGEPNPTSFCWLRLRQAQEALVDEASRQNIFVTEQLGLQDAAPTDPEEIKRTLRALNVVNDVVLTCIEAGVRRIQRIQIDPPAKSRTRRSSFVEDLGIQFEIFGSERALQTVLARLVEGPKQGSLPYLALAAGTKLEPSPQEQGLLRLHLSLSALAIDATDLELEEL